MTKRFGMCGFAALVLALVPVSLAAQQVGQAAIPTTEEGWASLPGAEAAKAFVAAQAAKGFTPPKTPWGVPDVQGNFTHMQEANTPLERPDSFAGKSIGDVTPQELADEVVQRQQTAVENAPFITGSRAEGIAIGVPIHWLDHLDANNSRPWFVIEPADGKIPPQVPAAAERAAARAAARVGRAANDSYLDRSLADRCIINRNVPRASLPGLYGNSNQILQAKDVVALRMEMIHETRFIPVDGRPLSGFRSFLGESRGHYVGNTLVVVTTNFNGRIQYQGASEKLRVIERFTRIAPKKVEWTVTLDDPETWTRPWTFSVPITEDDAQLIHEYACQEGNYAMANLLTARISEEKRGIVQKTGAAAEAERAEEGVETPAGRR